MGGGQESFVAGLSLPTHTDDSATLLQMARTDGYDFCTTALPCFSNSTPSIRRDVTTLESKWWSTSIVGEISDPPKSQSQSQSQSSDNAMEVEENSKTMNTEESSSSLKATTLISGSKLVSQLTSSSSAETILRDSIAWACHMNIPAVILPPVPSDPLGSLNYSSMLSSIALNCSAHSVQLWIRTPFDVSSFEAFELLCRRCNSRTNLGCLLCFGLEAPHAHSHGMKSPFSSISLLHRFIGHNVRAVSFDTSVFLTNKRGYPTLSKSYQMLFTELLKRIGRTLRVLVEGGCRHHPPNTPDANGLTGCLAYLQYLRHLRSRQEVSGVLDTEESSLELQYLDHLQTPLQPLGDDLEFSTYEVFEKDPIKYRNYQFAIELAIRDKILSTPSNSLEPLDLEQKTKYGESYTHFITIFVLGAGRGPLVRHSLLAVENSNQQSQLQQQHTKLKPIIVAIEKNPSAVLFLNSLKQKEGWTDDTVLVVESDMRYLRTHPIIQSLTRGKEATAGIADIIVSELLGSFGDNELSPECLDSVEKSGFMKQDCVSIPQKYTSFIAPVSSMRLHSEARVQAFSPSQPTDGPGGQINGMQKALETSYVVRSHASSQTHAEKPCFTFHHPKLPLQPQPSSENNSVRFGQNENERFVQLEFPPDSSCGTGFGCGYGPFDRNVADIVYQETGPVNNHGITVHGFLGTFDSILYSSPREGVSYNISIAPSNFSVGMFSWFPLYFPIKEPLYIPFQATLRTAFWRKTDATRVWYEWCAEVVLGHEIICVTPVHNPNGRSCFVRL